MRDYEIARLSRVQLPMQVNRDTVLTANFAPMEMA